MRFTLVLSLLVALASPVGLVAQSGPAATSAEPFKVGTFEIHGVPHVGIVLRDNLIVDLEMANTALETNPAYPKIPLPADMVELIGRYEYGLKHRLYEIVTDLVTNNRLMGNMRADFVHDVDDLRTLPPIMYPGKILNAAVNFYSHVDESGTPEERAEARRQRRVNRGVPYLFLKPSRGAVIGNGDPVVIPHGRDRTDWEVELSTVIGRAAKYVSASDAQDYVFGYMVSLDISDRGGPPPRRESTYVGLVCRERPRHVRTHRPVDRAKGVLRRPDGESQTDAERRRREDAGGDGGRHDSHAVRVDRVRLVDRHPLPGRRDQ